jgi:hypothetical protein
LRRQWARAQIGAIRSVSNVDGQAQSVKVYRLRRSKGTDFFLEFRGFRLVAYRDSAELRWIATVLRQALKVPVVEG